MLRKGGMSYMKKILKDGGVIINVRGKVTLMEAKDVVEELDKFIDNEDVEILFETGTGSIDDGVEIDIVAKK